MKVVLLSVLLISSSVGFAAAPEKIGSGSTSDREKIPEFEYSIEHPSLLEKPFLDKPLLVLSFGNSFSDLHGAQSGEIVSRRIRILHLNSEKRYFPHVQRDYDAKRLKEEQELQKYKVVKHQQEERDERSLLPGILDPDRQGRYSKRK